MISSMKKLLLPLVLTLLFFTLLIGYVSSAGPDPILNPPAKAFQTQVGQNQKVQNLGPEAASNISLIQAPTDPIPPFVVESSPEPGAEQPLDAPVEIVFDQPMNRDSVERAFAIEPGASADGTFEWVDDRTVRFTPAGGFLRGERYRVRVVASAESEAGLTMNRPFELNFSAVGFLAVANVQPAPETAEVQVDGPVTVMFNRPVVPLGALEQAASLPDPLTFTPPVSGQGEWLNTATYQFTPAGDGFQPATEYTARVAAGLADVTGQAVLEDDFEWRFTTISPAVVASVPAPGDIYVSPTPVISVAFNQLMDHESVEQNLVVTNQASGEAVPGEFRWVQEGLVLPMAPDELTAFDYQGQPLEAPEPVGVETVMFIPAQPLALETDYRISLPAGVASTLGTQTQNGYEAIFTITPPPQVIDTNPANGEQFADIWQGLDITFNAPMNPATVVLSQSIFIDAEVAATDVYSYWSNSDTMLTLSFPRQENQVYTVTLTTDVEGRYGQPLASPATISWKTLRQSPYVHLVSPKIAIYNGYQNETYIYMTVRNVNQVNFNLYRLSMEQFLQLGQESYRGWEGGFSWQEFQPDEADLIGQWQQTTDPETFVNYVYKVDISQEAAGGNALPPGLYYLEAFSNPEDFYDEAQLNDPNEARDRQILIVSRNNLTLKQGAGDVLAWLTDLQSGEPVPEVPLQFVGPADQTQTGTTDNEGTATFIYEMPPDQDPPVFVIAGDPAEPDGNFAVASTGWNAGIATFDFANISDFRNIQFGRPYSGFVYTERRIYRPGQTVYFKGIVRNDNDARYAIPAGEKFQVIIYDALYREVFNEELTANDWGTFNGSFVLDEDAPLGNYQVQVNVPNPQSEYYYSAGFNNFNVAEYRQPEFLVEAVTDQPEYKSGETIRVTVESEFFFGGPVTDAPVRWTLLSDPYFFDYQGEGFYDFTYEDNSRTDPFSSGFGFGEVIADGTGVTDSSGRFTFEAPADLSARLTSQTFIFDVAVTGLNNQEVATQVRTVVHKGDFYVGLRPENYVVQTGTPAEVEVLVVDPDSQPVANQEVELIFSEENWYSVQQLDPEASRVSPEDRFFWENLAENVAVFSTTVTTDQDGKAIASFTPDQGGNFKVHARAIDSEGRELFSSAFLWVTGYEFVNWGQENNDRIELVADQVEYNTGDTATVLIPHPYSGTVQALITLERGHIYEHFVTELQSNSDQIEIPITDEMSPNIYVSAVIIKGMDDAGAAEAEANLPGFKIGYTRLNVNQAEKVLNISLTPTTPSTEEGYYSPNQMVEYQIKVTDFQGQPVQAELSLALVDKAVLTLAPETPGQLLASFWTRRALEVDTGAGLTLALDRINSALDARKGGGGGDGGAGLESVRQNFADVPFWDADLVTDENGEAMVEVQLPDNLTTWVMLAKGVTGAETLVGESQVEIVTSKPLLVRPVVPRFLVAGDEPQVGFIVQNNGDEDLTVQAELEAEGLELGDWRLGQGEWQDAAEPVELAVAAGEEVKVEVQAAAASVETARLTMRAEAAELSDAVALELPVLSLSTPETVATLGVLAEDSVRLEGIALPSSFDPAQGNLTVNVEPSLAAGLQSGLTYLEHYPYESVEQVVSRFLPNIFTYRAYQQLNLDDPVLADELPDLVSTAIQRLNSQQNIDGGWGWWPGDESDPFLTAYVLLGLVEARRADFTVEDWVIDNTVSYLQQNFVAPRDIAEPWQANRQAFILYVLAEAGQGDLSRAVALYERRDQLDMYGRAFLALAIHQGDAQASQISTLIADLTGAAITSATGVHWEEREVDFYAMNSDVRSTAIIVTALTRLQPDHPLLPQAVRWLMTARDQGGSWSTTQETAWSIIGLSEWLLASGELEANYRWQVSLNAQPLASGETEPSALDETTQLQVAIGDLLQDMVNRLAVERDAPPDAEADAGNLYYAAYLTYYRPVEQVKALDRGIIVSRQYSLQGDEEDRPITEAQVGDFIEVKLTLIAPTNLHYVVVEDYLPAGTEALDSSLATTSLVAQQPELDRAGDDDRPWGWWYFTHTDLRDERAVLFADYLPQGVYEYTYTIRATIPGEYRVIPTHAEQLYFPETFGRGDGGLFRISN
jgi:uncharacterized protein YfaS (alpha-2-macroglobulin family)